MKRLIAIFSLICIIFSLSACSGGYEPKESSEKEKETALTLTAYGKEYKVRYELWRAFYLTYRDEIEGEGEEYRNAVNALVLERIADIYSVFALCDRLGIDLYSRSVEREIEGLIKASVEGTDGSVGFESYDDYLSSLQKMNLNYSTQVLLLRYGIGLREIDEYYIGTFDADSINDGIKLGELTYTREDIKEYYYSDACVRVLRAHIQAAAYYEPMEYAMTVKERMENAALSGESAVATVIINTGLTAPTEVERGYVIARHNLDKLYYKDMTDAAFALDFGCVSDPIQTNYGEGDVIFILYKAEKSDEHFEKSYSEIAYVYLTDTVGSYLNDTATELKESAVYTDFLAELNFDEVTMND